jgi:TPR repeat protein/serine/threonine protein kinase
MDLRKALPAGVLLDGKYRIERVIGAGGFGITYAAHDLGLNTTVALKEYYPAELSVRDSTMSVRARSNNELDLFVRLRLSFVQEARLLAKFRHPSIVRVISVFEAHGTAYMAMEFEEGRSLKAWMRSIGRKPLQAELDQIFQPLLDALEVLHEASFLHRDVAPDNIIIRDNGSPVLLDFGAARRLATEASNQMTGLVKQGYSPQEQYTTDGKAQGPWTDIYALGATLYHLVMGEPPPEATVRSLEDTIRSATEAEGDYRPDFLAGIDAAVAVHPQDRPQSIAELRPLLFAGAEPVVRTSRPRTSPPSAPKPHTTRLTARPQRSAAGPTPPPSPSRSLTRPALRIGAAASLLGFAMLAVAQYPGNPINDIVAGLQQPRGGPAIPAPQAATAQSRGGNEPASNWTGGTRPTNPAATSQPATPPPATGQPTVPPVRNDAPPPSERVETQPSSDIPSVRDVVTPSLTATPDPAARRDADPSRERLRTADDLARQADEALREGLRLANGTGGPVDHQRARALFEIAASAGRAEAMAWLGRIYLNGLGVAADAAKARDWFERAAAAGDVQSMAQLGQMFQSGQGTAQDLPKAREWYERAANAGHAQSIHTLGTLYYHGLGATQDQAKARELFERAAQSGTVQSMLNLAHIYKSGTGLPQPDLAKAREWYERAAALGNASAMNQLGVIYLDGLGVPKNAATARSWFERGVNGGNQVAMWNLAKMMNAGQGGAADYARAAKLLLTAAQQGGLEQLTQELNGTMAKWHRSTRTEIKRELRRLGHFTGEINDVWNDAAKKAINAYRTAQR